MIHFSGIAKMFCRESQMVKKGLIYCHKINPLSLAPRARLSAKLVWIPIQVFNDPYLEKHTQNQLFYL